LGTPLLVKHLLPINTLTDPRQPITIGIDFFGETLKSGGRTVQLQLWDTSGHEKFHDLIPSYLRNASVAILVYDVTARDTFELDKQLIY
jgi:Ras-related protein Rab-6A